MIGNVIYREDKLAEMILYVSSQMADDSSYGATVLNKVLFFADVMHYAEYGRAISGADYQRLERGPAPRRLLPVQRDLINGGAAHLRQEGTAPYVRKVLVALREADLSLFSGTEIAVLDSVITSLRGRTARSVSDATHRMIGWDVAGDREDIPYAAIFLYQGPVTKAHEETAAELALRFPAETE